MLKVDVEMALTDLHKKHNPRLTESIKQTNSVDTKTLSSKQRVNLIKKEAMITRAQHYKEDI